MNYKTGVLYESWGNISLRQFLDEKAQVASPWVFVGVSSGREAPKVSMNEIFSRRTNPNIGRYPAHYVYTGENIYGLAVYRLDEETYAKRKVKPIRGGYVSTIGEEPHYVYADKEGTIFSIISCSTNDVRNPPCEHRFRLYGDMNVEIDLHYSRQHLENWRLIEQMVEEKIRSWVVAPQEKQQ